MNNGAELGILISAEFEKAKAALDSIQQSIEGVGATATKSSDTTGEAMGGIQRSLNETKSTMSEVSTMLKSGLLVEGGKILTEAITLPLIGFGREAVLAADKLHQTEIAFKTLLGSGEKATVMLRDLQAFAASTPFNFPDLTEAAKRMLALGFEADQIIPSLTKVGDAVSGLGGDAGTLNRIILALGQMQAKGQTMTQEMRQLAEAGIPAWEMLAHKLGVTVPEAMELVSKKAVDGATGVTAIMEGMGEKFGGLMEQQSKTIQGTLANLQDTVGFIMTDIGREIIEAFNVREVLGGIQSFAREFLDWFKQLDAGTKQVLLVLTTTFAVGGPILVAVGAFMAAMTLVTAPLLIGGAIVAGIIAGVALILLNWEKIKDTGIAIWEGLLARLRGMWEELKGTAITQWTLVKVTIVGAVEAMVAGIGVAIAKLSKILDSVKEKTDQVIGFFRKMYDAVVGHSYVPDMVDEIGQEVERLDSVMVAPVIAGVISVTDAFQTMERSAGNAAQGSIYEMAGAATKIAQHMEKLDITMGAPARRAAITVENAFRGMNLTIGDLVQDLQERTSFTAGAMIQSISGAVAGAIQNTVNWAQVGQQMLNTLLTNFLNMIITWTTSWLIAEATRTSATQVANATIAASTTATATGMTAVMTGFATFLKTIFLGLSHAIVGVLGLVVGAINVVLQAIGFVLQFALMLIAQMLFAAAEAVQIIPILGQILGVILFAAGVLVTGLAIALPAVIAGLGAVLVAGVGAVASAIPGFAEGGISFGPAIFGEGGSPEAAIPLNARGARFMREAFGFGGSTPGQYVVVMDGRRVGQLTDRRIRRRAALEGAYR